MILKKAIFLVIMALLVSMVCVPWVISGSSGISVTVDGKAVNFPDAQPFIDANGRTLLPVRFVTESLGAKVDWNDKTKQVDIKKDNVSITIRINDRNIVVNNTIKTMDTKAIIKDSRTFVPIRYVAEGLGAKVGWNANTKTVIITTGGDVIKSYSKDYYRINPEMPEELYTYEYRKGKYEGFYETNKWMVDTHGISQVTEWMDIAKGYVETCYNVDYRTIKKDEFIKKLQWYFSPGVKWIAGDGISRTTADHIKYWADQIIEKKIIIKAQFITDPSLVVTNGNYNTRGRLIYTIESCTDMEWLNKYLPFAENSQLNTEHICDLEIELANLNRVQGWDYSIYVIYDEYLFAVIK